MRSALTLMFAVAIGTLSWCVPALAVNDVSPRLVLGQIATYGYDDAGDSSTNPVYLTPKVLRVFPYFFGDFTDAIGDPYFDNDPGIHALSNSNTVGYIPSGLPTGSVISFDALSDLQYWSGADPVAFNNVPAGETLNIFLGSRSTTIGTGMGFYPGFGVGAVDATGGLHKHLQAELVAGTNPTPADGVYLFEMRLKLLQSDGQSPYPGVKSSLPFFVLFDNNVSISTYQEATTWVQTNLVPFGDFNRDHNVDATDIPAMLNALADLNAYKSANQLTNFDLLAFGDIDSDGKITNADLQALLGFISSGAAMQLVPEPDSLVLSGLGALILALGSGQLPQAATTGARSITEFHFLR